MNQSQARPDRGGWVVGLVLVAVGLVLLASNLAGVGGEAVVLAIGVAFLVAYSVRRVYGFLVPGGILTGLGAGILAQHAAGDQGGTVVLGLGAGFITIYVVDQLVTGARMRWWPLIPGSILAVIGAGDLSQSVSQLRQAGQFWPLLLVAAGILLLVRRVRPQR